MRKTVIKFIAALLAVLSLGAVYGCRNGGGEYIVEIDEPARATQPAGTGSPTDAPSDVPTDMPTDAPVTPEPTEVYVNAPAIMSKSGTYVTYPDTNVMRVDDRAFEICYYVEKVSDQYAELVNSAAKSLKGKTRVFDLIIPLSYAVMMPDDVKPKISFYIDTDACIQKAYAKMPDVTTVSIYNTMMMHRGEFIYFRTDHHWTARGAYYAYSEFMKAAGKTANPLSAYTEVAFDGFLGTLYTHSDKDSALLPEETVYAYYPLSPDVKMVVHPEEGDEYTYPVIKDVSNYKASSKYMTFAAGDNPLTVFTNPAVTDGSVLIVVKESFGNAMMPFLCDHYSTVYEIDYRYWKGNVVDFAKEVKATDLLFVNYFIMTNSSSKVGKLSLMIN